LGIVGVLWAFVFYAWFRDRPEDKFAVSEAERQLIRGEAVSDGSIYDDAHRPRLKWMALLSPNLLALDAVSFCISFSFYFYITLLPRYLKEQFQIDYSQSQLITGLPLFLGALACVIGGRVSDWLVVRTGSRKWGRRIMPIMGWSAAGLCALLVSQLHSPTAVIILICVAFAFQDLGVPSMWSLPTDVGGRYAGTVGGCMNMAGCLGGFLSPLVSAHLSIHYGWNTAFVIFGVVYLLGALAWLRLDADQPAFDSQPLEAPHVRRP
jgi:nitrate/nitrite transporter NarK